MATERPPTQGAAQAGRALKLLENCRILSSEQKAIRYSTLTIADDKGYLRNSNLAFIKRDDTINLCGDFQRLTLVATTGNGLPNLGSDYTISKAFSSDRRIQTALYPQLPTAQAKSIVCAPLSSLRKVKTPCRRRLLAVSFSCHVLGINAVASASTTSQRKCGSDAT